MSGSEEAQVGVCTRGSWTLPRGSVHHGSDLPLPHGFALGVGLHPRVNATPFLSQKHAIASLSLSGTRVMFARHK